MLAESAYNCTPYDLFDAMYFAILYFLIKILLFRMTPPVKQSSAVWSSEEFCICFKWKMFIRSALAGMSYHPLGCEFNANKLMKYIKVSLNRIYKKAMYQSVNENVRRNFWELNPESS